MINRDRLGISSARVADEFALGLDPNDHEWMAEARCRRYVALGGTDFWTSESTEHQTKAKEGCLECPVFSNCQKYATTNRGRLYGVLAGVFYDMFPNINSDDGRVCNRCLEWKPADRFSKGNHTRCKDCESARSRELYARKASTVPANQRQERRQ